MVVKPARLRCRWLIPAFVLALFLVAAAQPGTPPPPADAPPEASTLHAVELVTVGFDVLTQSPIVLLREPKSGAIVPIWVGVAEARAIAWALDGYVPPRPMTHDLTVALIEALGAELVDVVVDDLKDNTFHGKLRLRVKGEDALRIIDTRPSDGLALALRTGATIHVADKILQEAWRYDFLPPDESRQVVHALGITVVKPTAARRKQFKLPARAGVVVTRVTGLAKERGLRPGDLIVQANHRTPSSPMEFFEAIRAVPAGRTVHITYLREGEERAIELPSDTPVPRPSDKPARRGTIRI